MAERFANNARTALAAAAGVADTTLSVLNAAPFPSQPTFRALVGSEVMIVTGGAGTTTWTVTRAQEGTAALAHPAGTPVDGILTAGALADLASGQLPIVGPNGQVLTVVSGAWAPAALPAFEPPLGNPATDGHLLSSTAAGSRSWVAPPSGGGGGTDIGARVYNTADISIASGPETALTFNSERFDADAIHDTATNPSRLTCKTAGLYLINGYVRFASHATGIRYAFIRLNGATPIGFDVKTAVSGALTSLAPPALWQLAVDDYVELVVFQNSGGALNVEAIASYSPEFSMAKL